jgi:Sulfatase
MKISTSTQKSALSSLWLALIVLSGFWLLLQLGLFLPTARYLFKAGSLGDAPFTLPWVVFPPILTTIAIHLLLWLTCIAVIVWMSRLWQAILSLDDHQRFVTGLGLWGVFVLGVVCANQIYFPRSLFADFSHSLIPGFLAWGLTFVCAGVIVLALLGAVGYRFWQCTRKQQIGLLVVLALLAGWFVRGQMQTPLLYQGPQPNIIIIGLDSLRPDHVDYYGSDKHLTPALDAFLKHAANFRQTNTTQGRTFPAWVSILTGNYPIHNGARYDLIDFNKIRRDQSIAKSLQQVGYTTIYATDEKRFSNIDESFGFDTLIGPKIGVNDFLLGNGNDFPLTNLIINTRLGAWLFPYNYANRGANKTYYPSSFTNALARFLKLDRSKPLFLNIHLCLPHWPYVWADSPAGSFPYKDFDGVRAAYNRATKRMDTQFKRVMQLLKQHHLLWNAYVVVISDHGESLEFKGDRLTQDANYHGFAGRPSAFKQYLADKKERLSQSNGHGTDVLSPSQNHVVMAWRRYRGADKTATQFFFPTSLIDIKPTLLDLLHLPKQTTDGISLKPYLKNPNTAPPERAIFIETGFSPDAMNLLMPNMKKLIQIGVQYYTIDPKTGRVTIKNGFGKDIIRNKQRSIIWGDWQLALYPTPKGPLKVLINLKTKQWTDNADSLWAHNTPLTTLWQKLENFYGKEISHP